MEKVNVDSLVPHSGPECRNVEDWFELGDVRDAVAHLGVFRVLVQEHNGGGWIPMLELELRDVGGGYSYGAWTMAERPSREAAWGAAAAMLRGLSELRSNVIDEFPWAHRDDDAELVREAAIRWAFLHMLHEANGKPPPDREEVVQATQAAQDAARAKSSKVIERTDWGRRMQARRKELGLTQKQLGEKVGLHQAQVSKLERSGDGTDEGAKYLERALGLGPADS